MEKKIRKIKRHRGPKEGTGERFWKEGLEPHFTRGRVLRGEKQVPRKKRQRQEPKRQKRRPRKKSRENGHQGARSGREQRRKEVEEVRI